MFTLVAYPVYPACSHCEWTGSILLKWLKTRGFFDESSQRLQCLKPQWLAEGGAERTTSFVFRSRTGKLDNHWAQLPHLGTQGGWEANYFKIHSLRKFEICWSYINTPHINPVTHNFFMSTGMFCKQNCFPNTGFTGWKVLNESLYFWPVFLTFHSEWG